MPLDAVTQPVIEESNDIFELLPGKVLDVQVIHPVKVRLKLPLIGYELGKYILVKSPPTSQKSSYSDVLVEGNVVVVRYLLEGDKGCCCAFRSTIKHITKQPEKFLILEYPKQIENRQLRLHQRIMTHLPAAISLNDRKKSSVVINGIIGDLSTKGCGFTFKATSELVRVNQTEVFVCVNHHHEGEIRIAAKVRNSRNERGKISVGIQFNDKDQQVAKLLEYLFIDGNSI